MNPLLRIKILVILSILSFHVQLEGQQDCSALKNENLVVHLPERVVSAGEEFYYNVKIYNIPALTSQFSSKVIYFSIHNMAGEQVYNWHNTVFNRNVSGKTIIPDTLSGGFYTLYVYTSFGRNFPLSNLFKTNILVTGLNTRLPERIDIPIIKTCDTRKPSNLLPRDDSIYIDISRQKYESREKAKMRISLPGAESLDSTLLSVSVCHVPSSAIDTLLKPKNTGVSDNIGFREQISGQFQPHYFENQGLLLRGILKEKATGIPLPNTIILLALKDTLGVLDYAVTNEKGEFVFLLDELYENNILLLHLPYNDYSSKNVSLETDPGFITPEKTLSRKIFVPEEISELETLNRKLMMINEVFNTVSSDSSPENRKPVISRLRFTPKPDYVIFPADFMALPDFKEIAANILPAVKYRHRDGNYSLRLFDPETGLSWEKDALVLLNGVPFNNLGYLNQLGSREIKSVSVTKSKIFYGDITFHGIVSILTHDNKIPEDYLQQQFTINNDTRSATNNRLLIQITSDEVNNRIQPLFHSLVYFNPSLTIFGKKEVEIDFYTPDLKGTYRIEVKGIVNGEIPVSNEKLITVQ
ncbi:MAG: hypothetical protein ACOC10_07535 [Bacteroidota bacterium]